MALTIGRLFGHSLMPSAAHGTFQDLVASAKPPLRPVCTSLRRMIAVLHRDFTEVVWPRQRIASFGIGPRKMSEHYAYIAVYPAHINLGFYHGATLTDRAGLLEGTGKELRHISFRDATSARRPAIATLLRSAIADRKRNARASKVPSRA
jgi:Domain of unknown function (DU1801)